MQRQSAALRLNEAPVSSERGSGPEHCYINSYRWDRNSGSSVYMLLDY